MASSKNKVILSSEISDAVDEVTNRVKAVSLSSSPGASSSSSPAIEEKPTITLMSSDGEVFAVDLKVASMMKTIQNMVEDDCASDTIPLPNVTAAILTKVLEYCERYKDDYDYGEYINHDDDEEVRFWNTEFVKVDQNTIFDIILAANYLNIRKLLELMCKTVANMMKGKTTEQLREIFHIKNDYTPEEQEEVLRENSWINVD